MIEQNIFVRNHLLVLLFKYRQIAVGTRVNETPAKKFVSGVDAKIIARRVAFPAQFPVDKYTICSVRNKGRRTFVKIVLVNFLLRDDFPSRASR